jgi:hypothetical protein
MERAAYMLVPTSGQVIERGTSDVSPYFPRNTGERSEPMRDKRVDLPPKRKQPYEKPEVVSEHMFDTTALACGMCTSGPFPQFACGTMPQY